MTQNHHGPIYQPEIYMVVAVIMLVQVISYDVFFSSHLDVERHKFWATIFYKILAFLSHKKA